MTKPLLDLNYMNLLSQPFIIIKLIEPMSIEEENKENNLSKIKRKDFWRQTALLILYITLSPFVFDLFYPYSITGDGGILYLVVFIIVIVSTILSIIAFAILNSFISPIKTYKLKGGVPLLLSNTLLYIQESGSIDFKMAFLWSNSFLLLFLYFVHTWYFYKLSNHN